METWQLILTICGVLATLAIFWANIKNSYSDQERRNNDAALESYKTVSEARATEISQLRNDIKELHRLHTESVKQNGMLQGQIDAYAKLPLQEISNNQRIITQALLLIAKHHGIEGIDVLMQEVNRPTHKVS